MIRQIKLEEKNRVGSLVESEPFFLLDDECRELQIEFVTDVKQVLIATVKNGDKVKQFTVRDRRITLHEDLIFEGELEIVVCLYQRNLCVYKWTCEPITIVKAQKDVFEAHPKITALESELFDLQEEVKALKNVVGELQKQVEELWQIQES